MTYEGQTGEENLNNFLEPAFLPLMRMGALPDPAK
jgi:hypothetical protein